MRKKLLLVDDDVALRKQIVFALQKEYEVIEASDRKEAEEFLRAETIDIALVDLGLPPDEQTPKQGMMLCEQLLRYPHIKVLVLTGQESEAAAKELVGAGVFDYLSKPVSMEGIVHALKRASFFTDTESLNKEEGKVRLSFNMEVEEGFKHSSDEAQKQLLLTVLERTGFNIYQTAKLLGVKRENIYYFIKKFHIRRPEDG